MFGPSKNCRNARISLQSMASCALLGIKTPMMVILRSRPSSKLPLPGGKRQVHLDCTNYPISALLALFIASSSARSLVSSSARSLASSSAASRAPGASSSSYVLFGA